MQVEEIFSIKNGLASKRYVEVPTKKILPLKKGRARKEIQDQVFDLNDSVADNAKMISLMFSIIQRMWYIIPDEQKSNSIDNGIITQQELDIINSVIIKFKNTETWADIKWKKEGSNFADKLISRQGKIGNIMNKIYNKQ